MGGIWRRYLFQCSYFSYCFNFEIFLASNTFWLNQIYLRNLNKLATALPISRDCLCSKFEKMCTLLPTRVELLREWHNQIQTGLHYETIETDLRIDRPHWDHWVQRLARKNVNVFGCNGAYILNLLCHFRKQLLYYKPPRAVSTAPTSDLIIFR